jgi:hypothetical protein
MRLLVPALLFLSGCSTLEADPAAKVVADHLTIADVQNPKSPQYAPNTTVDLPNLTVLWVDTFDETMDGKSMGTVFVQDFGSNGPYSAISVYQPSFVPSDLRPLPGDVLDMAGPYQEVTNIGSAVFTAPQSLPQLAKPVGAFRYEWPLGAPRTIDLADLDDYAAGRQWEGQIVTVQNVYAGPATASGGRVAVALTSTPGASTNTNTVAMSNEEYALTQTDFPPGTHFQSVTGIVTWFFSYHIAPRSPADLVQ